MAGMRAMAMRLRLKVTIRAIMVVMMIMLAVTAMDMDSMDTTMVTAIASGVVMAMTKYMEYLADVPVTPGLDRQRLVNMNTDMLNKGTNMLVLVKTRPVAR